MTEILHYSPNLENKKIRVEYMIEEIESTALDSVFNLLLEKLTEGGMLSDDENNHELSNQQ